MCKYYVIKYLHIYAAQCTLEYIYNCSTSQHTGSCLTLPRLFYAAGVFPSEKERKGEDPSVSHVISQIKHADRKSYLKRQEKEKVLCVNASTRKTGNSVQQIRIVSSEKSCIKYYSNHLCVRNLGIMSLHFTNTWPEHAPAEWVWTSATDSSRVPTGLVASFRVPSKVIHIVLSAYLPSHQHIKHLPQPSHYPTPPGLQFRKVFHFWIALT